MKPSFRLGFFFPYMKYTGNLVRSLAALYLFFPLVGFFTVDYLVNEAILLVLTSIALLTTTICLNGKAFFSKTFLYSLTFFAVLFILSIAGKDIDLMAVSKHLLLGCTCYFFYTSRPYLHTKFLRCTVAISLSIMCCLFIVSRASGRVMFYPNDSILSITLAGYLSFLLPLWGRWSNKKTYWKYLHVGVVVLAAAALILTGGRAGIAGLIVAVLLACCLFNSGIRRARRVVVSGLVAMCLLLASLLLIKTGSSSGRLLIYKVTLGALNPSDYVLGIGYGKFKARYNEYQAVYFQQHPIDGKEAMLADNTYYAFNEYFQLIVETGLIGIVLIIVMVLFFCQLIRNVSRSHPESAGNSIGALCSITCILIASLFSYPMQVLSLMPLLLLSIAVVSGQIDKGVARNRNGISCPGSMGRIVNTILATLIVIPTIGVLQVLVLKKQAERLSASGFKLSACEKYAAIHSRQFEDKSILYPYAVLLNEINQFDQAEAILNASARYIYNDRTALLKAALARKRNLLMDAERLYKQAVWINPKSFGNRFMLFNFYVSTAQFEKANSTGHELLALKAKVPSEKVTKIKEKTGAILHNHFENRR